MKKRIKSLITILLVAAILLPNFTMVLPLSTASAASVDPYPVELAFNNIFVFDKWAGNTLSTTMVAGGAPVKDKLDINIGTGNVVFTNQYATEAYTGHGMGQGETGAVSNAQYYVMEVEPGATYTFSYNLKSLTSGLAFTPFVFFFDEGMSYTSHVFEPTSATGKVNFVFTAPVTAKYIQIRFTISGTGTAAFDEIAIRKTNVSYSSNIFSFSDWANNSKSGKLCDDTNYNAGTVSKNIGNNSVTLTTNSEAATKGVLFTNFTFGNGDGFYMMPVEAGGLYSLSYNLTSCNFATNYYSTYIVYYNASKNYTGFVNFAASSTGINKFDFTVPAGTAYIQVMFGISGIIESGKTCTIKDTSIYKSTIADDPAAGVPHRKVYTYNPNNPGTYGTLPTPTSVPAGYVFAGWYTDVNGTGDLITENTPIHHSSYTAYPKYEPIVNSISIKTMPIKTEYTVGERVNPTGLVLEATVGNLTTTIDSGYRCTPEYLNSTGEQIITVHYGGKTATYTVNVSTSASKSIVVNGSTVNVDVANNLYTFAGTLNTGNFNRYTITYNADAYFEGIITYHDGTTEQFFLEPSSNFAAGETPKFTSFVDGYLEKVINGKGQTTAVNTHYFSGIKSIKFTPLSNQAGSIDLLSITTKNETADTNNTIKSFSDDKFKVEVDILNGGVVSGLYVLNSTVVARVYEHKDANNKITYETKVDYRENLPDGHKYESTNVNLINIYDTGRYLQQSYYGTLDKPYEPSFYNGADWHYNPVQGGNVANEASKVIDYEIGSNYIYVKARPLDWARWSDEHAAVCTHETEIHTEPKWGDGYITDTYVEAKYVFEDGTIKTYCRMVDYSGLPSTQTSQELPAFYTIEPLNNFVYNDVSEDEAWVIQNLKYEESPEFWGVQQDYISTHYPNGFNPSVNVPEKWAAFMASESTTSFGIGLYTPETTSFFYGCYPAVYSGTDRHAQTTDPANEDNTSYIAPIGVKTFESFKPTEYSYALTTGQIQDIKDTFGIIYSEGYQEEISRAQIAVPETIYMTPSAGQSTTGQYFVNNRFTAEGEFVADAKRDATKGIISVYAPGSTAVSFNVKSLTSGIGDPVFSGTNVSENSKLNYSVGSGSSEDWFVYNALDFKINGTGVSAGGTALLEWEVTIYYGNGDATGVKHYAYTTLYSPWLEPVGAATRAQTGSNGKKVYDQSVAWISGVHGYTANASGQYWVAATNQYLNDEGEYSGKGTYYAKTSNIALVPLLYGVGTASGTGTAVLEYLSSSSPGGGITSPTIRYFNLTANSNKYGCLVADVSPVANLTVDTSRYANLNQIPNLTVGYNITDIDNSKGVIWYVSDFTDIANTLDTANNGTNGTGARFYNYTKQDSSSNISNKAKNEWFDGDGTGKIIYGSATENCGSSYVAVSGGTEYNAAWNREILTGSATSDYIFKGAAHAHSNSDARAYSINYVQLRTANVNKANLRDTVILASSLDESNYTAESWAAFKTALQNAAYELGNPTDSDVAAVTAELNNKMMALQTPATLVANGGKFSDGKTTATVNLTCGPALAPSYTIPVENNPTYVGYVLGGWSTDANATEGSNPVKGGLKPTFYAIWTEGYYTIVYNANGGAGYIADVTVKITESFDLALLGYTREGFALIGWSTNANATAPDYILGQTVSQLTTTSDATVTIYAVWAENKYTVIYNANGGTGSIPSKTVNGSETFSLPTSGFTKDGCELLGWATNPSAYTPEYQLGQSVNYLAAAGEITLYAVWEIGDLLVADVVAIDFAAPIIIAPTANDETLNKYSKDASLLGISTDKDAAPGSSVEGEYGRFEVVNGNVKYTPSGTVDGTEVIYYHVKASTNGSAKTHTETITVAPASNVLYEEDIFTVAATGAADWSATGTAANAPQDASGTSGEIYGFDSGYNKIQTYSGGNALKTTVSNDKKTSKFASFSFTGTGYDLIGACGADTGVLIVSVKNSDTNAMVKSYVVDTYYGDTNYGTLNQVPIIVERGLAQGNYTVQIASSYLTISGALKASQKAEAQSVGDVTANVASGYDDPVLREALAEVGLEYVLDAESVDVIWFDENSTFVGGMGANTPVEGQFETAAQLNELVNVIDCVRVYNPIVDGSQYYIASERNASYINIMENLLSKNALDRSNLFAYVSGNDKESVDIENYETIGSKDELYLAKSTEAIAFTIKNFDKTSGGRVMISLRAAYGNSVDVKICNTKITLTSNTEMYYDITDYIGTDNLVTIQNMSEGTLLSVGSLKLTDSTAAVTASISSDFDIMLVRAMLNAPVIEEEVEPEIPVDPEIPDDNDEPVIPDEPTDSDEPADSDEPDNNEDPTEDPADEPTDSEEPATDDEGGCPFIWLLRWIVDMFRKLFSAFMDLFGF